MVGGCLISLREGVMEGDARAIISETTEIWLGSLLFLHVNSHDLDLVISQSNLDFELVWHDELISLNGVVVILLLLNNLKVFLAHHLLLLLLQLHLL